MALGALPIGDSGIAAGDKALGSSPASTKTDQLFGASFSKPGATMGEGVSFGAGEKTAASAPLPSMPGKIKMPNFGIPKMKISGLGGNAMAEFFNYKGTDKQVFDMTTASLN